MLRVTRDVRDVFAGCRRPGTPVGGGVILAVGAVSPICGHPGRVIRDAPSVPRPPPRLGAHAAAMTAFQELIFGRGRGGRWPVLVVPVVVGVLAAWAGVYGRAHHGAVDPAAAVVLALAATGPLALSRRWPLPALALVLTANAVYLALARLSWPAAAVLAWLVAMFAAPLLLSRRIALTLLVASETAVAAAVFIPSSVNPTPWDASVSESLALLLAWAAGGALRGRRETAAEQAEARHRMQALQEREAVNRGRAAIARDLHDVVAHHVALVAVRAATAEYQVPDLPTPARAAFAEIAAEARTALAELRALLGVLRAPGDTPPQTPQPGLADLPALVDRARAGAVTITLDTTGAVRPLPEPIELCCYRVVQEALTNATRHAPGSAVSVRLSYDSDTITLVVRDTGRPGRGGPVDEVPARAGYGLIGMRERIALLGGHLIARPDRCGFAVTAVIPLPETPGSAQ